MIIYFAQSRYWLSKISIHTFCIGPTGRAGILSSNILAHILDRSRRGMQESGSIATLTHQKFFRPPNLSGAGSCEPSLL